MSASDAVSTSSRPARIAARSCQVVPIEASARKFVIGFYCVGRLDLRKRAGRAHARQHAIACGASAATLANAASASVYLPCSLKTPAASKAAPAAAALLGDPIFVAAPCADAGDNQDGKRDQIDAVAIPQLLELFAPDFLVYFMKNIGHKWLQTRPWPTPGRVAP